MHESTISVLDRCGLDGDEAFTRTFSARHSAVYGLVESILIKQIYYWYKVSLRNTESRDKNGVSWFYKTYEEWQAEFPSLSERTIRGHIKAIASYGFVIKKRSKHKVYYTFNVELFDQDFSKKWETVKKGIPILTKKETVKISPDVLKIPIGDNLMNSSLYALSVKNGNICRSERQDLPLLESYSIIYKEYIIYIYDNVKNNDFMTAQELISFYDHFSGKKTTNKNAVISALNKKRNHLEELIPRMIDYLTIKALKDEFRHMLSSWINGQFLNNNITEGVLHEQFTITAQNKKYAKHVTQRRNDQFIDTL